MLLIAFFFDLLVFLCALLYSLFCLLCINPLIVAIDGVNIKMMFTSKNSTACLRTLVKVLGVL